ncbi:MAG: protein kinase [Staphylococcus rostri]|uniref:protein kinase domain-containing protein n=1 Tax=Staphylococcus rostri TaxID=522262 RepID=UPI0026E094C1|nr:protein kinase [Staphylococcus rostri]MDO5376385.1 protein kinase [Staphylococcus rostri]
MLTEETLKEISEIFNGDRESSIYTYKTGPQLVKFFNQFFDHNDTYGRSFPSRWYYVTSKLQKLIGDNNLESFFNIVLSNYYLQHELKINEVEAVKNASEALESFNKILKYNGYYLMKQGDKYRLLEKDEDLKYLTSGGFAHIYVQKSTGHIIKKLKPDFYSDLNICRRVKREYDIANKLSDMDLVINVYEFDESDLSYSMEQAEMTLYEYINKNIIEEDSKIKVIRLVLYVIGEVHKKNIIHRDLSPTNILILNGRIKVSDFGLGKDLDTLQSQQTLHTNNVGQFSYCAPEQLMGLKDGNKKSDVFSLGRIINFVMTGDPHNFSHQFNVVSQKATNDNPNYRYDDAKELYDHFEKIIVLNNDVEKQDRILKKIGNSMFDEEVEVFYSNQSKEKLNIFILKSTFKSRATLLKYMQVKDNYAETVIQHIDDEYENTCQRFENYDVFADFMYEILSQSFSFRVNEIAAKILNRIAYDVNRFYAQRLAQKLIKEGVEPIIENILSEYDQKNESTL